MECLTNVFIYVSKYYKASFSSHGCLSTYPAPSAALFRIPKGLLDLEEMGAGLRTGLFRLMLQEVAQHPGNGW